MIYNFPLNTGINLEAETVAKIAQHPNVCGIKDSSGNIPQAAQIIDQTPKTFHVLVGAASALLPSLAIGASGVILALGLICAPDSCAVNQEAKDGQWTPPREALRAQLRDDQR